MMGLLLNREITIRTIPFFVFAGITVLQGKLFTGSEYWLYFGKTIVGAVFLGLFWRHISELSIALTPRACLAGLFVFLVWVGLDSEWTRQPDLFKKLGLVSTTATQSVWNPFEYYGNDSGAAWFFVGVRVIGSGFVVPPLEEVFYRSFLYRFLITSKFEKVPLNNFDARAFFITALIFGLAHREILAGFICGLVYQWLVLKSNDLGEAIVAHGVTNICLGVWVVGKNAWHFW